MTKFLIFKIILFSFAISSCKEVIDNEDNFNKDKYDQELQFRVVHSGNQTLNHENRERKTYVINTKLEESNFLNSYFFNNTTPFEEIDYSKKMLLGILMPVQGSGSNQLTITDVSMKNGKIVVSSELTIPSIGTTDIGYPMYFVEIDKSNADVTFLDTKIKQLNFEKIIKSKGN